MIKDANWITPIDDFSIMRIIEVQRRRLNIYAATAIRRTNRILRFTVLDISALTNILVRLT